MKALFFFLALALLCSCEDIAPLLEANPPPRHIEVHVQAIDANVYILVDGKPLEIHCLNGHCVRVLRLDSLRELTVFPIFGKKATLAIHDYIRGHRYDLGEITCFQTYALP